MGRGNPNPSPSTRFVKGQSGCPTGRPLMAPELKGLLKIKQAEILHILAKYSKVSLSELEVMVKDKSLPAFEIAVGKAILKAIELGDTNRLEWLLLRSLGKVKDQIEVSTPKPYMIVKSDGTKIELGARIEGETVEENEIE